MTSAFQVQGPRPYQEDFYFVSDRVLAVLDGHGGRQCAMHCAERLVSLVPIFNWEKPALCIASICATLASECAEMDSGAALSIVHLGEDRATVGILGDSPVIIEDADGATNISPEHNVRSNPKEAAAAKARGGHVANGYVCNADGAGLQMSRALGDRRLRNIVSTVPEIYEVMLGKKSAVLVATDGVVDPAHTDTEAQATIANLLRGGADAKEIIKAIPKLQDNATAIVWNSK